MNEGMVEAAGIEPASETARRREPTCLVRSTISVGARERTARQRPSPIDLGIAAPGGSLLCLSRSVTPGTGVRARRPRLLPENQAARWNCVSLAVIGVRLFYGNSEPGMPLSGECSLVESCPPPFRPQAVAGANPTV